MSLPAALHLLRPGDIKHIHEFLTVSFGTDADATAGQRHTAVLHTHRGVKSAQKGPEVRRTLQVNHGVEGLAIKNTKPVNAKRQRLSDRSHKTHSV